MKQNELFYEYAKEIMESPEFSASKQFIQHGTVTVYVHSVNVASVSFSIAHALKKGRLGKTLDLKSLVRAALLHDFFLYDWHTPERMWSLHGWTHPVTAARNAGQTFGASEKERSLIRTHMWPYTLLHPPQHAEGWIICLADKICSAHETLFCRKKPALFSKKGRSPAQEPSPLPPS
jgi:uncharacterized protein